MEELGEGWGGGGGGGEGGAVGGVVLLVECKHVGEEEDVGVGRGGRWVPG